MTTYAENHSEDAHGLRGPCEVLSAQYDGGLPDVPTTLILLLIQHNRSFGWAPGYQLMTFPRVPLSVAV